MKHALLVLALAATAHAGSREQIALRYDAPAGCPDRAAFEAAIRERTPAVEIAATGRAFAVAITPRDAGFTGSLVVDGGEPRQLSASRCDDLVTALSLIAALAIDPAAGTVPRDRPPVPLHLEASAGALVDLGVAPDAMPAGEIEARAGRGAYGVAIAALAGYDHATLDMGGATFWWLTSRLSGCRRWSWSPVLLDGCAHVELGAVRARGEDIVQGRALTRLWAAGGAHAAAQWPATASMFAQLQAGLSIPATRDRYLFQPNVTIHETSLVTMWVWLGIGMRFR